ncbi:MAG: histidine triad nucleotide-binding protein [Bacteroidota bacterium]|jgi:histidine triad (HIT) family protein
MPETLFTKIINREIPAEIVYEDDSVLAFNDIKPQAPVHVLIVPKTPIPTLNEIEITDVDLMGKIVFAASAIAKAKGISEGGYRLVFNCNEGAGQTVFHIHCHLLGGRLFSWPPG